MENLEEVFDENTEVNNQDQPDVNAEVESTEEQISPAVGISESGNIKIDFRKLNKEEDAVQEQSADESVLQSEQSEMGLQEVGEGNEESEEPTAEKIEQPKSEEKEVVEIKTETTEQKLPENIDKLIQFMEETGGSVEDYVRLNTDYDKINEDVLLIEYYQMTNPDLSSDEIDFMIEDKFFYDEDEESEKDIKRKQLAKKSAVKEAKKYLEDLKNKYYQEIKSTNKLTPEQKEAVDFYNRYKQQTETVSEEAEKQINVFKQKTEEVFSNDFKGFEFNVGEKQYRINVKNVSDVKAMQSDINNFVKKFLNEDNVMKDAKGYHKALYTAMNADLIAQHFYEQGKADAVKQTMEKSKNIDMNPRGVHEQSTVSNGWTIKSVNGTNVSDFKLKIKR